MPKNVTLANSGSFWQHCNEQYIREYLSYIKEHTEFLLQETSSSNRDYISMEEDPNPFLLVSRFQVEILFDCIDDQESDDTEKPSSVPSLCHPNIRCRNQHKSDTKANEPNQVGTAEAAGPLCP